MRLPENPLIRPQDVPPTRDDFEVVFVFNPAVTRFRDELIPLMRIAERPRQEAGYISFPLLDLENDEITIKRISRTDPRIDAHDPRVIVYDGVTYLSVMSHLRLARSMDGVHLRKATLLPLRGRMRNIPVVFLSLGALGLRRRHH